MACPTAVGAPLVRLLSLLKGARRGVQRERVEGLSSESSGSCAAIGGAL